MRRLFALLLFAFAAATSSAVAGELVKPDGLGFAVEFPAKPSTKEEKVDLGDGKSAMTRTFQILAENAIYDVTIADYPQGLLASIGEQQVLDNARDGAVGSAPGPLLSETKIEFAGRPTREILVDMSMSMVARTRIFIVGDRLFTVGAVTHKDKTKTDNIEKYFASFRLEGAPAGTPSKN